VQDKSGAKAVDTSPQAKAMAVARQAEIALIGSAFRSPDCIAELSGSVKPEHFRGYKHGEIWRAILNAYQRNGTIDVFTVGEDLHRRQLLGTEVHAADLEAFACLMPSAVQAGVYAKELLDFNAAYELSILTARLAKDAGEFIREPDDLISETERQFAEIQNREAVADMFPIAKHFNEVLALVQARRSKTVSDETLPTGFVDIDMQIGGGLRRGDVCVIAARPSMGKSALAMNLAENAAIESGAKVLVVSLEMSGVNLAERMLARASRIHSSRIRSGAVTEEDIGHLTDAVCRVGAAKLFVAEIRQITLTKIATLCRRLKMREGLDLLVIDYLQLMQHEDKRLPRQEQIADLSRRLKMLAMDLKIPVVALSQLNRNSENRGDNRPRLSDLRESGAIEQDADTVMLIYRPEMFGVQGVDGVAEIDIAKQRNGPVGIVRLSFVKEYACFENKADDWMTTTEIAAQYHQNAFGN